MVILTVQITLVKKKKQNRINSVVTIVVQTTLFQVQNHKNKVIFQ